MLAVVLERRHRQCRHGRHEGADALLLGRGQYEAFAGAWPEHTVEDDPGAGFMNDVKKYVVSRTLTNPVPDLMGTPTEVPLVMDRSTRALTVACVTGIR